MKILSYKAFITIIMCSFGLYVVFSIGINALDKAQTNSTAIVSQPTSSPTIEDEIIDFRSNTLGVEFKSPKRLATQIIDRNIGNEVLKNIIKIRDQNDPNDTRFDLEIIPIKSDHKVSALGLLESYIVKYVGIIPKNNQKTYKLRSWDVAQIGYHPFKDDGINYFRVFTIIKNNQDDAWLFSIGYTADMSESDSLNFGNKTNLSIYFRIFETFKLIKAANPEEFNLINISNINHEWLESYHSSNSNFDTNI